MYKKNPTLTAQQVFDQYIRNLVDITTIKQIDPNVVQRIHNLCKNIIKTEYMKIIGDTLIEIIREDAKQRRRKTRRARKEFQNAREDDVENRKTAGYINKCDDEIDDFFQSNPEQKSTKKQRKSSDERGSSEADNERDKDDESDYILLSEYDDEWITYQGQSLPPLLVSSQLKEFQESYAKMNVAQKWFLSSGKFVEDTIFEHCKVLSIETYLHSWIIDLDDQEAEMLFNKKFEETKLGKAMHDILVCLSKKVHFEETKIRKLRVAGMLHLGLKSQVLQLSSPKWEKLLEIPATIENIKDLIRVLASVWMLKEVIRMGTESPPPTVVLP
ncbi:13406_t:CDS:2 [Funneliformis geosporum]|uniref:13406_t:CDS:1 n=1 Tax=Funneliformis geosporum TaxID=1117311 RepID=A0A9W4WZZ0_9GLOM|nr:13406_t:CDS:2 [Funneliformis geosporum]